MPLCVELAEKLASLVSNWKMTPTEMPLFAKAEVSYSLTQLRTLCAIMMQTRELSNGMQLVTIYFAPAQLCLLSY